MVDKMKKKNKGDSSFKNLASETGRAMKEFFESLPIHFKKIEKNGDEHTVLVVPGFMTTDFSTATMRNILHQKGYKVKGWGLGRNLGKQDYIDQLVIRVERLYRRNNTKVSLIGVSLGGIFAREIAKKVPDYVRQVITVGSPFAGLDQSTSVEWIFDLITFGKGKNHLSPEFLESLQLPPNVPLTCIYTKEDGVVSWETCIETKESPLIQNVEVKGSHFGLAYNPEVLEIVKDRLMYDEANWQQYISTALNPRNAWVPKDLFEESIFN